ncbi:YihY family inner membrane protein [Ramlibacter aurantiacus]|nr:YihY family inner membrane protein [Ramlibacter aurantiacus]
MLQALLRFPWRSAAQTLGERISEDRLSVSAGSLTFTTTIALVPFFAVVLSVFTAFPVFSKLEASLQTWLMQSLVPDAISRQVMNYLTQFAGKASRVGVLGLAVLVFTAVSLVMTIEGTLNGIWRVRRPRPIGQRLLLYWAALTLGPLVLGASVSISSYVLSASRGFVSGLPEAALAVLDWAELLLLAAGMAAIYRFAPNAPVRARHAWIGGLFAAVGIEVARQLLALYLAAVPTYSAVYGAFATVPILLVWIYVAWMVVLLGAVLTAYLPSLTAGPHRQAEGHGWQFQLALQVLRVLERARPGVRRGLSIDELTRELQVTDLQLEPVLDVLQALDWVGLLQDASGGGDGRYILLADVQSTSVEPLVRQLLLPLTEATERLWRSGRLSGIYLKDTI